MRKLASIQKIATITPIKEARELILNKYNMWPMINEIIQTERLSF